MKVFFLTNSILLLGPRDHFDFIFLENRKNGLLLKQTQKMRGLRGDDGQRRGKIIIDPAHAFPYYEKPLLRFSFSFRRSFTQKSIGEHRKA